jgi:hypothetical protein
VQGGMLTSLHIPQYHQFFSANKKKHITKSKTGIAFIIKENEAKGFWQ